MLREEMKIKRDKINVHKAANKDLSIKDKRAEQLARLAKILALKEKEIMLREEMKIRRDKINVHKAANVDLNQKLRRGKQVSRLAKIQKLKL